MAKRLHFHFSLSCIGEGNGNPLQCSCLENPRDEGAWGAAVYGIAQSRTRLKRLSSSSGSCFSDCVDHNKLWKILQEVGVPDHLTCLLRNLCASQAATVRTRHGTTNWFRIEKEVRQGCLLSACLCYLYTERIRRNARLDELQAGVKIGGRNINNLRYMQIIPPLMAENEGE